MTDKLLVKPENYWAHHVYKVQKGGKPFIACLLRRKYGDDFEDVDDSGTAELTLGITAVHKKRMIWDNNPDSETFQQRIPDPNDEGGELQQKFTIPMTDEVLEDVRKMCGESSFGGTQYFWMYHGKRPIQADSLEELIESDNLEILKADEGVLKKTKAAKRKSND